MIFSIIDELCLKEISTSPDRNGKPGTKKGCFCSTKRATLGAPFSAYKNPFFL